MWNYILLFTTFLVFCLLSFSSQECIRFEFYENAISNFGQSELIKHICSVKGGKVIDYSSGILAQRGPYIINITFNCCSRSQCISDHDCPINFNCHQNKCQVAECSLTDDIDLVQQEGRECFIDEDCTFAIPYDFKNWKCLPDPKCRLEKKCIRTFSFCKRCPSSNSTIIPFIGPTPPWVIEDNYVLNDTIPFHNKIDLINGTNIPINIYSHWSINSSGRIYLNTSGEVNNMTESSTNTTEVKPTTVTEISDKVNNTSDNNTEIRILFSGFGENMTESSSIINSSEETVTENFNNLTESNITIRLDSVNVLENLNNLTENFGNGIDDFKNYTEDNYSTSNFLNDIETAPSFTNINLIMVNSTDNFENLININETHIVTNIVTNVNSTLRNYNSSFAHISDNLKNTSINVTIEKENFSNSSVNLNSIPSTTSDFSENNFNYIPPLSYLIESLRSWNWVHKNNSNDSPFNKTEKNSEFNSLHNSSNVILNTTLNESSYLNSNVTILSSFLFDLNNNTLNTLIDNHSDESENYNLLESNPHNAVLNTRSARTVNHFVNESNRNFMEILLNLNKSLTFHDILKRSNMFDFEKDQILNLMKNIRNGNLSINETNNEEKINVILNNLNEYLGTNYDPFKHESSSTILPNFLENILKRNESLVLSNLLALSEYLEPTRNVNTLSSLSSSSNFRTFRNLNTTVDR